MKVEIDKNTIAPRWQISSNKLQDWNVLLRFCVYFACFFWFKNRLCSAYWKNVKNKRLCENKICLAKLLFFVIFDFFFIFPCICFWYFENIFSFSLSCHFLTCNANLLYEQGWIMRHEMQSNTFHWFLEEKMKLENERVLLHDR
jgi:hypothetical protein